VIRTGQSRDAKRYAALRRIGCIACVIGGFPQHCGPVEVHHLVDKGYRKHSGGNLATIPLARYHHQGIPFMDRTVTWMRSVYGPSMALESKEFARVFGSQRDLLAKVNELLTSKGKEV
jgi:hypothetical protein